MQIIKEGDANNANYKSQAAKLVLWLLNNPTGSFAFQFSLGMMNACGSAPSADPVVLEITGDGITTPTDLYQAQLESMEQYQHVYVPSTPGRSRNGMWGRVSN